MDNPAADQKIAHGGASADRQTIVVAVHGVGAAGPGDILSDLLRQARLAGTLDHLLVCGVPYPRAQATGKVLYEIPWVDLRRKPATKASFPPVC
jgi:hypothetical protein